MAYIDIDFYRAFTHDADTPSEDISPLLDRCSDIVEQLCHYQIGDLSRYNIPTQTQIKKATATLVEYLASNGGADALVNGVSTYGGSIRIGDFSYGDGRVNSTDTMGTGDARVSKAVIDYLLPTGLLYAGVRGQGCV